EYSLTNVEEFAKATGKTVEEVKKSLNIQENTAENSNADDFVQAKTKNEAVQFAEDNGVKFAVYDDIPLETANIINNALMTLPEEARPKSISSVKNLQKAYGSKIRNSKEFYGVSVNTTETINFGNGRYDFDGGEMIGINTTTYKTLESISARKEKVQAAYIKKTGNKWFFNETGEATVYHEFGHAYENYYGLPTGFESDAKRWLKESGCDILKSSKEAWAEAWGAYHTGNKDLPDYISKYIEKATAKTVVKSAESGIIKAESKDLSKYLGKAIVETDNQHVREWYVANVSDIQNQIDKSKSFEEQVKQAYELRNKYKHEARVAMSDRETAETLERKRPAPTFDELLKKKMKSKGLDKEAALKDILKTASTTNVGVNKEFGL
ncbi:MAG: hypothetical protein LUD81_06965, partial [Clostridiales bacterium]|nr:hypothetical protein [Clostridiales bacterium]